MQRNRSLEMQREQTFDKDFSAPADLFAIAAAADERAGFIMKTYMYVFGAIAAFIAIETFLFTIVGLGNLMAMTAATLGNGGMSWLIVLGAFMVVSWIASAWASSDTSPMMQHVGLGVYIVANAIIFVPLLCLAQIQGGPGTILSAAMATAGLFAALTLAVFITRKDFSFLRSTVIFGGLAAMGFIMTSIVFGLNTLGPVFAYVMIAFMCVCILYHTSNVLHHYRIGQHVAAALALFASVMTLFWYVLQLFLSRE